MSAGEQGGARRAMTRLAHWLRGPRDDMRPSQPDAPAIDAIVAASPPSPPRPSDPIEAISMSLTQLSPAAAQHYAFLSHLHARLRPEVYLETGVETGRTLELAKNLAIGIDPNPQLKVELRSNMHVYAQTSDDFFAAHDVFGLTGHKPIDLAFIDGLHLFEAALNDFINIEKYSQPGTVVCIHDVLPHRVRMGNRTPQPDGWTGDVFGLVMALREHRPDLFAVTLDLPPTGMLVLTNLDAGNSILRTRFTEICAQHLAIDYAKIHDHRDQVFSVVPYSEAIVDYLVENLEISRARRRLKPALEVLSAEPRVRLGAVAV
jgi:predicted O-methyltransferase YrrM